MNKNEKEYDLIVFIGRFQPPHLAHIQIIKEAERISRKVLVLVGSANQPRTIKNPWTWQERGEMIKMSLPEHVQNNIAIRPLHDKMYNDQEWVKQVQDTVMNVDFNSDYKIGIIGYR